MWSWEECREEFSRERCGGVQLLDYKSFFPVSWANTPQLRPGRLEHSHWSRYCPLIGGTLLCWSAIDNWLPSLCLYAIKTQRKARNAPMIEGISSQSPLTLKGVPWAVSLRELASSTPWSCIWILDLKCSTLRSGRERGEWYEYLSQSYGLHMFHTSTQAQSSPPPLHWDIRQERTQIYRSWQ